MYVSFTSERQFVGPSGIISLDTTPSSHASPVAIEITLSRTTKKRWLAIGGPLRVSTSNPGSTHERASSRSKTHHSPALGFATKNSRVPSTVLASGAGGPEQVRRFPRQRAVFECQGHRSTRADCQQCRAGGRAQRRRRLRPAGLLSRLVRLCSSQLRGAPDAPRRATRRSQGGTLARLVWQGT